jgi:uncharacterized membrane protein
MSQSRVNSRIASGHEAPVPPKQRVLSIDLVRGLVMVLMALDHVRDFFGPTGRYDPTDLSHVSAAMFLTRLVTHLCAPTFVFLAGTSAFLSGGAGRSRAERSRYLLVRGLWLIFLELTIVHFGWALWSYQYIGLQVIWALGCCMIVLAGLIWLPLPAIAVIGGGMVLLHNLLDRWGLNDTPLPAWLWSMLHVQSSFPVSADVRVGFFYPLVPWIGVMALGYAAGVTLPSTPEARRRRWLAWGIGAWVVFVILRASRQYGDPTPWTAPASRPALFAFLAFFNTQKYPPSLLYLLMTLGTMFLLLAAAEGWRPGVPVIEKVRGVLLTFGRVALFYYLVHLLLIHALRILDHLARFRTMAPAGDPGYHLPGVYAAWAIVLLLMYPLCARYDAYKRSHPGGWTRCI